ncbi:MAG: SulP family inorganic anion transporter [Bacteroidota bacterium]
MNKFFDFRFIRNDLLGGITAGIVALPLALAFGEQSGLGAAAGLYGAAFLAFFAAMLGGTATQISGPTAPMTALSMLVIAGIIQTFEGNVDQALPVILMVFMLAGFIQIGMGALKLGTYIKFIPYTVVSGFMTGIGVIIIITQLLPALGYNSGKDAQVVNGFKPHAEELILNRILAEEAGGGKLVMEDFEGTISRAEEVSEDVIQREASVLASNSSKGVVGSLKYLPKALGNINWTEFLLALITIFIIYGFKRITTVIPSTLVALVAVTGGAIAMGIEYVPINEIPSQIPTPEWRIFTEFNAAALAPYIVTAFMLALLGAIDSLLTSVVADNLTKTRHQPNRELIGQGIGNSISALFAGLPGAGATIRTVVNIQAGGKTKISGMIAGLFLLIILISLAPIASMIPAGVLAGILLTVGIGVMDYKGLKALPKMEWSEKIILITVLLLTVFWQLVYAVGVGLVMAALVFLKRMSDISTDTLRIVNLEESHEEEPLWEDEIQIADGIRDKVLFKHLDGPMFFGIVNHFRNVVANLKDSHILVIRMEKVPFIDQSGMYALESVIGDLHQRGVIVVLCGVNEQVAGFLRDMLIIPDWVKEKYVFDNFEDCSSWLRNILSTEGALDHELKELPQ